MLPLLPLFTLSSFGLLVLVSSHSVILSILSAEWIKYSGFAVMLLGWGLLRLQKIKFAMGYDLIAFGSLLAWFIIWQTEYSVDKLIFLITPVLFTLVSVITTLTLTRQRSRIDPKDIELVFSISWIGRFSLNFLPFMVLGSLFMPKHYLFYPILMALFVIRFALETCLRDESS